MRKKKSKRFTPSKWNEYLVPILLVLLLISLLATLVIVALSLYGLTPGT
jgi:competence protein ComGC